MHTDGNWVYEDRIVKPKNKKASSSGEEYSSSSAILLSDGVKAYFDDWFGKILDDNQVREDQIMSQMEVVVREEEEGRQKIKEEVKT